MGIANDELNDADTYSNEMDETDELKGLQIQPLASEALGTQCLREPIREEEGMKGILAFGLGGN